MKECSRNKLLVGLVEEAKASNEKARKAVKPKEGLEAKEYNVAGYVHPLRPEMTARGTVPVGKSVEFAIKEACKSAGVRERHLKYGIAQIGTRDFEKGVTVWKPVLRRNWKLRKLKEGELLRFRLLPQGGGGGGGKNPLRTILTVVVMVVAIAAAAYTGGASLQAGWAVLGMSAQATATMAAGLVGMAISTIGMVLINAVAPVKAPSFGGIGGSSNKESQVYSVSAGKNSINQWGRVPAPLGCGRFAAPKAASPYTETVGEDQFLHELLCLGIGDMSITDLKIGATAISEYNDCQWEIFRYDPANPRASELYPTGVYQEDLNIQLKKDIWNSRTTASCDRIEIDFGFQGLCYYNDQGDPTETSVEFKIQYRPSGDDTVEWTEVAERYWVNPFDITLTADMVSGDVGATRDFVVHTDIGGTYLTWDNLEVPAWHLNHGTFRATKKGYSNRYYDSDQRRYVTVERYWLELTRLTGYVPSSAYKPDGLGYYMTNGSEGQRRIYVQWEGYHYEYIEATVSVSGGYLTSFSVAGSGVDYVTYSGSQARLLRKTYTIVPGARGQYDVRILRITDDSTDDRLRNDAYWTALRSATNDLPVQTSYPVTLLALKIKATGQLSGSIDTLTHYYETKCLDYDSDSGEWVWRYTSNPASLFRYILQNGDAMARPQADSVIDLETLEEAHEYWHDKGWTYNLVCDSSVSVFERLQSICAAGLASPTMVDGKWSIVIDKPRTTVACAFTSANAWQWTFKRTQVRLPNAIHCTFISDKTWDNEMRVVATDEPETGEYLYETQTYEGVNNAAQVFQLARFHYADAKVRRRTISLRCYDEALLCTRGDLVECACPSLSPQGLQVGRVRKVTRDSDNNVVSFTTDQSQTTEAGRRFGVRVYTQTGAVQHAEVRVTGLTEKKITLLNPQQMDINDGDKYAFGDYSEEVFQAIVISLRYNSDWTCDVTLQDYAPQIYGNLEDEIPDFESVITKPIELKWFLSGTPIIVDTVTDESVLLKTANGGIVPRIMVYLKSPNDMDKRAKLFSADISESGKELWRVGVRGVSTDQTTFYINNVEEGKSYDIRVRYEGVGGEAGEYAYARNITVIGKTTPPSDVTGFTAEIVSPIGIKLSWSDLTTLDIAKYRITGATITEATGSPIMVQLAERIGTQTFNLVAVDTGGRVSPTQATASVNIEAPDVPAALEFDSRNDGLYLTWEDCATTWPIQHYEIEDLFTGATSKELKTQFLVSPRAEGNYELEVQAVDIFGNKSEVGTLGFSISPMEAPVAHTEVNNGVVRIKWNPTASFFPVRTYQVFSVDGVLLQETDSTFYDINGPSGVLEYRIRAIDVAGNVSPFTEIALTLTAPSAPTVAVALNANRDGLVISWNKPDSMLPVLSYDIVRQYDVDIGDGIIETREEDYGTTDSLFLDVLPIAVNTHTFMVRATDASGNKSGWGYIDFVVRAPSTAFINDANTIDNNIMIYWQEPRNIFFAISHYEFSTVEDGIPVLIGRIDARFASRFERLAGEYTYQVCPVDVAGNIGPCSTITARVAEPPDFIMFNDYDSLFNGTLENCMLDGEGGMYLPLDPDETWSDNLDKLATMTGMTASNITWQNKIDSATDLWLAPWADSGTYIEVVDIGTDVPASNIAVTVTRETVGGWPELTCKIETSLTGEDGTWIEANANGFTAYSANFRFVRYTFTVTGGLLRISNINYRLDVKRLSDFGSVQSNASDNGEGFVDVDTTPDLYGTWVPFNVSFTDVQSGPMVFCNEVGKTAYVSFEDVYKPLGFRTFVLDSNGNRVSGRVSWSANGV